MDDPFYHRPWRSLFGPRIFLKQSLLTIDHRRAVLQEEFVNVPKRFIELKLRELGHFYATYLALELAEYTYEDGTAPYARLKRPRRIKTESFSLLNAIGATGEGIEELRMEVEAARKYRQKEQGKSLTLWLSSPFLATINTPGFFVLTISSEAKEQETSSGC